MKNYYDELEVSKTASKEVIERVYKVLAKKYHPDTTKEIDKIASEEKFKIISEAYEILSDEEKRKQYDIELEQSSPTISYEDYINVVNQRDSLNITLNNLKNEYNYLKASINSNTQQYNTYTSNFNNSNQVYNNNSNASNQNFNNTNNYKRSKYYNVTTGKPVSAFTYYYYKIKQFIQNIGILILIIIVILLALNSLTTFNISSLFNN